MDPVAIVKFRELLDFLTSKLKGNLDGTPFECISIKGTNHKHFVIKGWISEKKGPMVKISCPWGQLSDGQVYYQPSPDVQPPEETDDEEIHFSKKKLTAEFVRLNGGEHKATYEIA